MKKQNTRFWVSENPHRFMETSLHPAKCIVYFAVWKQELTGLIFVEDTMTNQQYLQQLQNEVIPVIQGVGVVDTTFFQYDGECPHRANAIDILHDVFDSHAMSL
jgi:hypothetical protein